MKLKNITLTFLSLCLSTTLFAESTQENTNQLEKALKVLDVKEETKATDWYLETWKAGYAYSQEVAYKMNCEIKLEYKNKKENFFSNMFYSKLTEKLKDGASVKGKFQGIAVGETNVLATGENLCLFRCFPLVNNERLLYLDLNIPDADTIWNYFSEGDGITHTIAGLSCGITYLVASCFDGGATVMSDIETGGTIASSIYAVSNYYGNILKSKFNEKVEESKIEKTDYGFKVDSQGELFKKYLKGSGGNISMADDFGAIALDFNDDLNVQSFFIEASKQTGELKKVRHLADGEDITILVNAFVEGKNLNDADLTKTIARLKDPSENVVGLFQRESFALNKEIFDAKERKLGDTWAVNADFFNSFLHPDLSGKISGRVVLKYTEDDTIKNKRTKEMMNVRVIEIQNKAMVNGKYTYTDLIYKEEANLEIKWGSKSMGYIYVDIDTGIIVEAYLAYNASSSAKLPRMLLTDGFESAGDIDLTIEYNCYATKIIDIN